MKNIQKKTASVGWDGIHLSFHSDIIHSQIKPNEGDIFFNLHHHDSVKNTPKLGTILDD